jgi:XXXCH domain-containing protein
MQFKQLKMELEKVFTHIKSVADEGETPALDEVKQFVRLCEKMQHLAPEEWAFEVDDFVHLATQLLQSVKNHNIQDIVPLVTSLDDARTFCHRTFKD